MDVVLPRLPQAGGLIAGAVLTTPRRPPPTAGLPGRRVVVHGVRHEPARLAAYGRVCGFALRDEVPATWLHVLSFPLQTYLMAERDFPFRLAGLVHVSNVIEQYRPVRVTEPVDIATAATGLAPHRRGVVFDLVGEVRVGPELVWRGTSTYLARGASLAVEAPEVPPTERPAPVPPTARWRLPADLGRRYAAVSGDINPIHLSAVTARPFGFRRPIVHGMWTYARVLSSLDGRLPHAFRADMRFLKPIPLPATVSFGEIPGFHVAVVNADQQPYLTGSVAAL
ncbi:MaoC family dehydratase [Propionicicella superfundia]|uniref:MaoC family dehydratase n=1 Tax=Propionicicella superfundia TaxID=348582 RepID=UPI0003F8CB89|nr:MaoC/PaaZ C-terminal domain-containing protein [Propionicicella superfundia]